MVNKSITMQPGTTGDFSLGNILKSWSEPSTVEKITQSIELIRLVTARWCAIPLLHRRQVIPELHIPHRIWRDVDGLPT